MYPTAILKKEEDGSIDKRPMQKAQNPNSKLRLKLIEKKFNQEKFDFVI